MIGAVDVSGELSARDFAEEKFRLAVESCPSGMVMTDGSGTIVLVNTATEQLFGYRRDELIGRHVGILIPPRLHAEYFKERAAYLSRPQLARFGVERNFFAQRRDGSEFPVEIDLNPIRSREGPLVLSVVVDVSERKRLDRLKDEFVSTVSHELRTPLTSIAASLGLLAGGAGGALPAAAAHLIGIAESNSRRLVRLINDILDIEKIESGQVVFKFRRIDARALAEQVIDANRGYADSLQVKTTLDAAAAAEVYSDPDRLAQVLTNLLSNALKFSPPAGEVAMTIEPRADKVCIAVRDHGPGIPSEFRPRVFEKFAQAGTADARRKGGTGLGLSIVKEIVTRLGGSVGFDDAAGGGTVFHVELPSWNRFAAREIDAEAGADAVHILLCEDEPDAALALREGLRPFRFGTDFAYDPADAVARAQAHPYAAILIDLDLADGEGINLIRALRRQPPIYHTPIVAMSATGGFRASGDGAIDASSLKVLACIEKPVDIERLAQTLDRAIVRGGNGRPQILHVDDDHHVLELVARALGSFASVVSVDSIGEARSALLSHQFDLVILDISVDDVCGLDLLPELRDRTGAAIPVVVFSALAAERTDPQVAASLNKASASLKDLVAAVHDRLAWRLASAAKESV